MYQPHKQPVSSTQVGLQYLGLVDKMPFLQLHQLALCRHFAVKLMMSASRWFCEDGPLQMKPMIMTPAASVPES